jgi:integrase
MTRNRRFQHGSLYKRGKRRKVWVARWWEDVIGADGAIERFRRFEILSTVAELPNRRDAERLLADRLRRINSGDYRPQSARTFREYIDGSWLPEVLPTLKYSTKNHYQYTLNVHLLPAFGDTQLRLISRDLVQNFIAAKLRSGLAWKTVKHLKTVLGTALGAAETAGHIDTNPVRKTRFPRRGPAPERVPIAPEKIRTLLDALPEPSRSLAWLLVLTGLRIGELLALRWQDVDLEHSVLRVRQSVYEGHFDEPKTKHSSRTIPLGTKAIEILTGRKLPTLHPDALVFSARHGAPLSRRNLLNRQLKPTAALVGLKGINWHWLRHANATLHDSVGTPLGTVAALLGHSSPEITQGVYLHSVPADARQAVGKVEKALLESKWTQTDTSSRIWKIGKLANSMTGLEKVGRGERI